MKHLSDDELILHYYGEDDRYGAHLQACAECATRHRALASMLETVTSVDHAPPRGDRYGLEVWQRIRHRLPAPEPWWRGIWSWQGAGLAMAALMLIAVAFTAGRFWPAANDPASGASHVARTANADVARRVLLLSVADHFERSERVLTDVMNAPGGVDLSAEQQWAVDLVSASRLYRQDAIDANEMSVAAVLDELERTLLEIVHSPAQATAADLDQMRRRIDSAALLFKVRVMSTELRELTDPDERPSSSSTRTIG
jgi:hypothetical protein